MDKNVIVIVQKGVLKMNKPNILFIVADQFRADSIGYNGCEAAVTPNVDQLAREGVGFSNAYSQNTVCVPSRCSFMTGWYPHTNGFRTMHHLMKEDRPNLLKVLKEDGYHVYWGGRNDFLSSEVNQMDYCSHRSDKLEEAMKRYRKMKEEAKLANKASKTNTLHVGDYSHYKGVASPKFDFDTNQVKDAMEYIKNRPEKNKPLAMYVALNLPHPPYMVEQKYYDIIDPAKISLPIRLTEEELSKKPSMLQGVRRNQELYKWSDEQLVEMKRVYYAMGTKLDALVGDLVNTLKEQGIYDETMIVFISDHGDYTGDFEISEKSQNTFEDFLSNVPMVIKTHKEIAVKPRVTDALVELIDIQATFYDMLNIKPGHTHFGKSLIPVLAGEDLHRDAVFCEGGRLEGEDHCMDAGHNPDNEYWARTIEQTQIPQHTKATMIRSGSFKYVRRLYETDELYDLLNDPFERKNVINEPEYKDIIAQLKEKMLTHYQATCDVVPHKRDTRS